MPLSDQSLVPVRGCIGPNWTLTARTAMEVLRARVWSGAENQTTGESYQVPEVLHYMSNGQSDVVQGREHNEPLNIRQTGPTRGKLRADPPQV